ncbi:MAG: hypothetical protein GVY16_10990 [Planctomycetes bacterium]|jgi:predicted RND superfamily exporter protein|nr:hypothetical protein [Planctomycetota bacterium]
MHPAVKIILLVVLPLAWGLGIEYAVELYRRRRRRKQAEQQLEQTES